MTTADLPTYEDADESTEADEGSPKGLRENLKAANARIKELEQQVTAGEGQLRAESMTHAYRELKLDPEQGIGRAAAALFQGEAADLAQFVQDEFGYVASPDAHPYAEHIALGQAQLDQVGNVADSFIPPQSRSERLTTARASGDYEAEGAILSAQMDEMMSRQRRGL